MLEGEQLPGQGLEAEYQLLVAETEESEASISAAERLLGIVCMAEQAHHTLPGKSHCLPSVSWTTVALTSLLTCIVCLPALRWEVEMGFSWFYHGESPGGLQVLSRTEMLREKK